MKISVEEKNKKYTIQVKTEKNDKIDKYSYGILVNNRFECLAEVSQVHINDDTMLNYHFTSEKGLQEWLKEEHNEYELLSLVESVVHAAISLEEDGLYVSNLVLDKDKVFVNEKKSIIEFAYIPIIKYKSKDSVTELIKYIVETIKIDGASTVSDEFKKVVSKDFDIAEIKGKLEDLSGKVKSKEIKRVFVENENADSFQAPTDRKDFVISEEERPVISSVSMGNESASGIGINEFNNGKKNISGSLSAPAPTKVEPDIGRTPIGKEIKNEIPGGSAFEIPGGFDVPQKGKQEKAKKEKSNKKKEKSSDKKKLHYVNLTELVMGMIKKDKEDKEDDEPDTGFDSAFDIPGGNESFSKIKKDEQSSIIENSRKSRANRREEEALREETERRQREEALLRQQEEAARRQQEEAARRQQEEAARRQQEEAARRQQEEAARRQQEETARRQQEEIARRQREETARRQQEETARRQREEAARRRQEEAEQRRRESADNHNNEDEARRQRDEARRQREMAALRQKEEVARRQQEEMSHRATGEELRRHREDVVRRQQEELARSRKRAESNQANPPINDKRTIGNENISVKQNDKDGGIQIVVNLPNGELGKEYKVVSGDGSYASHLSPKLIRIKTNEICYITKSVFKIGKEKSSVDYFINNNPTISRLHAMISCREGRYFLVDTKSTNHTYINGTLCRSNFDYEIKSGDVIKMSNEEFKFLV